ncbi:hypothetical protein OGAPHI_004943 [Ogataea philodendri]|uniref:Uncharacterized protein n=1 Tax=Ogataea philodendri TaxID=1378263 RepID=A0A9P8P1K9_9ASCO|nr:uncharacterized protein OGAPHI_004943 [Ogataea philodendri]KAH3663542.1 hypothetical protein OGAPHI_004943 [Ogataea philodendri]
MKRPCLLTMLMFDSKTNLQVSFTASVIVCEHALQVIPPISVTTSNFLDRSIGSISSRLHSNPESLMALITWFTYCRSGTPNPSRHSLIADPTLDEHEAQTIPWMPMSARYSLDGSAFTSTSTAVLSSDSEPCVSSRQCLQCSRWLLWRLLLLMVFFAFPRTKLNGLEATCLVSSFEMSQEITSNPAFSRTLITCFSDPTRSSPLPTIVSSPLPRKTTTLGFPCPETWSWQTVLLYSVTSKTSFSAR